MLLKDSNKKNHKGKDTVLDLTELYDEDIVREDEEKFQEYFLDTKGKKETLELCLNKELIEQHQERIVEQEEEVPSFKNLYHTDYKVEKPIKSKSNAKMCPKTFGKKCINMMKIQPLTNWLRVCFNVENRLIGLKGGSDHIRKGNQEFSLVIPLSINLIVKT